MSFKTSLKEHLCRTGSRAIKSRLLPRYPFNFNPAQLVHLCACLEKTRDVDGPILEIGCAAGHTTIFLNKYMEAAGIRKKYICIDTFSGFTSADIEHEKRFRGKEGRQYRTLWSQWSDGLFRMTMDWNRIANVRTVKADINEYQGSELDEPPSFCLVDVDLYRPVKAALERLFPGMRSGSIIVVDDCRDQDKYDGALQAYREFVLQHNLKEEYWAGKLGIIYR